MRFNQAPVKLAVLALVFTLLVACGSSVQSSESDSVGDSQSAIIIQETPVDVDKDESESQSEDIQLLENYTPESNAKATEVPGPTFDPDQNRDGMVMVYVPEGEVEIGTSDEQKALLIETGNWERWNSSEQPIHTVYLDAFWIDKTEVTNGQYALCLAEGACQEPHFSKSATRDNYFGNPEFDAYPVVFVDWYMAEAYCAWAGRRLPTEAEWEKAARGTDGRLYPWGNEIDDKLANYGQDATGCEGCDTTAVGSYPDGASTYGALDMAGNVWEWVADEWDENYYDNSPSENPQGPSFGSSKRTTRGGSWNGTMTSVRSATRYGLTATYVNFPGGGIRCAASP